MTETPTRPDSIHDAYRTGWNRALEDAAQAVRNHKITKEN